MPNYATVDIYRYLAFTPSPGPSWKPSDFDFDRDPQRLSLSEALNSDTNPDLRRFKSAGGKLLMFHGWDDTGISPLRSIDYYETVERTMGGRAATQDFMRLFLLPGVGHCSGGAGADTVDYLDYVQAWAENGQSPDTLIAFHLSTPPNIINMYFTAPEFPVDPTKVVFTRPIYPYPLQARYKGTGDPNRATSFVPVKPTSSNPVH
jgi:feruloyl esterase